MHRSEPTKISVSILSDSRLFRESVAAWLKRRREIDCAVAAGSVQHLLGRLAGRTADVLLAHANVEGVLGRELLYGLRTLLPSARLVVLESRRDGQDLVHWIGAGAAVYLEQDVAADELLQAIVDVARGCPCAASRYTRVIGPKGRTTCRAAHAGGRTTAEPLDEGALEAAVLLSARLRQRRSGRRAAAPQNSSPVLFRDLSAAPAAADQKSKPSRLRK